MGELVEGYEDWKVAIEESKDVDLIRFDLKDKVRARKSLDSKMPGLVADANIIDRTPIELSSGEHVVAVTTPDKTFIDFVVAVKGDEVSIFKAGNIACVDENDIRLEKDILKALQFVLVNLVKPL